MKFKDANLTEETKRVLNEINYQEMTEIQEKAIPVILSGKDIIGQSKTGTGKTAAYGLPVIEMIDRYNRDTQAIILCPTRELATQVTSEIRKFLKYKDSIKTVCLYGGQNIDFQIKDLKRGAQIIIGTPGRVIDHIKRKTIKLSNTKMVVLDEADEMLDMGFEEDINIILKETDEDRQTLLFSATMSPKILKITKRYLKNPVSIKIKAEELTVNNIEQIAIETKNDRKDDAVKILLDTYNPRKAIIFCNTKRKVDRLIEALQNKKYSVDAIHGDKNQSQREKIMKKFKKGDIRVLIATDVAARGIDVENLDLVINYDVPQEEEYYVHRIGRTGRNGNTGRSFTLVVGKERNKIASIEKLTNSKIKYMRLPKMSEANKSKIENVLLDVQNEIDKIKVEDEDKTFNKLMKKNNNDAEKIARGLLAIVMK